MSEAIVLQKSTEEALKELLRRMLEEGKVQAAFLLLENDSGGLCYSLVSDPDLIERSKPFFPVMPVNAGAQVSTFTLNGPPTVPVAALLRPCELRAFVELVKLTQGYRDNILFVSCTCPGVYPFEPMREGEVEGDLPAYWEAAAQGKIPQGIRQTCKACEEFIPYTADVTVALMGEVDPRKEFKAFLNTEMARELTEGFGERVEAELAWDSLAGLKAERGKNKQKLLAEISSDVSGLEGLVNTFGRCISCHGCMHVCPICSCKLCYFESRENEWKPDKYEPEVARRGAMRVPPGTVFYHLGRLTHMSLSCVGCGQCSEVCPVDIPLSAIFMKVGEQLRQVFGYLPGRDYDEPLPLTTFKRDEFTEVGEA